MAKKLINNLHVIIQNILRLVTLITCHKVPGSEEMNSVFFLLTIFLIKKMKVASSQQIDNISSNRIMRKNMNNIVIKKSINNVKKVNKEIIENIRRSKWTQYKIVRKPF